MLCSSSLDNMSCYDMVEYEAPVYSKCTEIQRSDIGLMSHKELQHYIRLENNKSEKFITNEVYNSLSHLFGCCLFLIFTLYMVSSLSYAQNKKSATVCCMLYGLSQVVMFFSSALYHFVGLGGFSYGVYIKLKALDHIAIYVSIFGSYLPIVYIIHQLWLKVFLICFLCLCTFVGITVRCLYGMRIGMKRYIVMYIVMGTGSIAAFYYLYKEVGFACLALICLMGILYIVGAVLYYTKVPTIVPGVFQSHEVWHSFVLVASVVHMVNVMLYIMPQRTSI